MVVFEVNEVTLYKMGVGWLASKASFSEKEVLFPVLVKNQDDFLKTFHVDVDGESLLSSIAFDTEEGTNLELEQNGDALTSILDLLSGSNVSIETKDMGVVKGRLVGYQLIENDEKSSGIEIIVMTEEYEIKHISSDNLNNILPDEEFFKKSLDDQVKLLAKSKKEDVKNIKISFTEEGDKVVTVSYLTELPAWLSSYRIYVLDDKNAVFELWSLVTNNSQQDWIDAQVHLITGLPISFRYDISSPWIIDRPYVERPKQMGVSVMTPESTYDMLVEEPSPAAPMASSIGRAKKSARMRSAAGGFGAEMEEAAYEYEPKAEATADIVETTESVSFSLKQLVTIQKGESALLMLHSANVPIETINIYNKQQHKTHPFKALEVENTAGYGWEAGPVTLYEKGEYAGEAMIPRVTKGEKQIIPYLVEQDISIKQIESSSTKKIGISLANQYYVESYLNTTVYKLEIDNKSEEEKSIICEVPKLYGYELDKKKCKTETKETPNFFRIILTLEPKTVLKLEVPTFRKTSESVSIASISDEYLSDLLKLDTLKEIQVAILKKIRKFRKDKYKLNEQIEMEQANLNRIDKEYQRITQSINVLKSQGEEGKTRAKYVERMNNLFETMEEKRKLLEEARVKLDKIDEDIYKILDTL